MITEKKPSAFDRMMEISTTALKEGRVSPEAMTLLIMQHMCIKANKPAGVDLCQRELKRRFNL